MLKLLITVLILINITIVVHTAAQSCSGMPVLSENEKCSANDDMTIIATVALRAGDAAASLSTSGVSGAITPLFWTALDLFGALQSETDSTPCILNVVQKKMNQQTYLKYREKINGYQKAYTDINGILTTVIRNGKVYKWDGGYKQLSSDDQEIVRRRVKDLVADMRQEAHQFRTLKHEYNAGMYFLLPQFASLHFSAYELMISIDKMEGANNAVSRNKKKYFDMILYYSQIALRFYRIAKENYCSGEKECKKKIGATYHCFLPQWAKLSKTIFSNNNKVKKYIEDALESNVVKNGNLAAFKSTRYTDDDELTSGMMDTCGDNRNLWLSCWDGKREYCYLRNTPGKHITNGTGFFRSSMAGEFFLIYGEGNQIRDGGKIGLKYRKSEKENWDTHYWLSLYSPKVCKGHLLNKPFYSQEWFNTEACPGKRKSFYGNNGCGNERFTLRKITPHHSRNKVIENGDLVEIWWEEGVGDWCCEVLRCGERDGHRINTPVFGGPFEIVTGGFPETNKWDKLPTF